MALALKGRTAIVTGASRGIGAAIARELGRAGAHVILVARSSADLEQVETDIHAAGGTATIAPLDLADGDSIARLAAAVQQRWPVIDMIVLNAAMLGTLTPVTAIDGAEFNRVLTLNVLANQALLRSFDPMLRASEQGRVIAITSSVGRKPRAYWAAYGASKAALETLVLCYGEEVKNLSPVRVAVIDPGATATNMREKAFPGEDPATLRSAEALAVALMDNLAHDAIWGNVTRI